MGGTMEAARPDALSVRKGLLKMVRQDSHTRWIVGIVSAALIALLGFLLVENYRQITTRMETQSSALTGLMAASAGRDERIAKLEANQGHIMAALDRIEDKLDRQETLLRRSK